MSHLKRLNFGPHSKATGLSFEEYVLNALNRIEQWSYEVNTVLEEAESVATTNVLLLETGDALVKESGTLLSLES
jgi:chaperonin cofactor prefoldin